MFHRRLEHPSREGSAYFITWRLHGSLPAVRIADRYIAEGILDAISTGPTWLERPDVAQAVAGVLLRGKGYELGAWVLMPNHAHILLRPLQRLGDSIAAIKGASAHAANRLLGRTGEPFWAKDYFDHRLRNFEDEQRTIRYIESNPVKVGLCAVPEDWLWSSANPKYSRVLVGENERD